MRGDTGAAFVAASTLITGLCLKCWSVAQVLACRLSPDPGNGELGHAALQGADLRSLHGQVCGVCQDERPRGVQPEVLLHDG